MIFGPNLASKLVVNALDSAGDMEQALNPLYAQAIHSR